MDADGPLMEQPSSRRKGPEQEFTDRPTRGCYQRTLAVISGLVFKPPRGRPAAWFCGLPCEQFCSGDAHDDRQENSRPANRQAETSKRRAEASSDHDCNGKVEPALGHRSARAC